MKKKTISVIIPVYNVEEYLPTCLDSVLSQTYKTLEIILVDDGATDLSGKICDEYAEKDARIIVLHCENGGLSAARNRGIKASTGEYLTFVDSDDIVAENMIEYLEKLLDRKDAKLTICDVQHCYQGREYQFEQNEEKIVMDREQAICELWYQKSFLPSACGKLYKRELCEEILFPENMIFEDIAVMHELIWKAGYIVYGKAKLYGYMHREDSITTQAFQKKNLDILKVCKRQHMFVQDKSLKLKQAARVYEMVGCLRIYLNAPKTAEYNRVVEECRKSMDENWKVVYHDPEIRKKLKLSLILYRYFRPLMSVIYSHVDRWK